MPDDRTVTFQQIRNAFCERCADGQLFLHANGWPPDMFHPWPEASPGSRVKCGAFDIITHISNRI